MKKKYTKWAVLILIPVIVVCCVLFINSGGSINNGSIKDNWNIKISGNCSEDFSTKNDDGYYYSVVQFDKKLKSSIDWKEEKDYDFEIKVREVLQALNIDKENYPNFYTHYKFYEESKDDDSVLYLIYNEDDNKLVIAEHMK